MTKYANHNLAFDFFWVAQLCKFNDWNVSTIQNSCFLCNMLKSCYTLIIYPYFVGRWEMICVISKIQFTIDGHNFF